LQVDPPDPANVLATHIDVVLTGLLRADPQPTRVTLISHGTKGKKTT
jgi:hypothetical protein